MSGSNSNANEKKSTQETSLGDLYNLMKNVATREHIDSLKDQIATYTRETNDKIHNLNKEVQEVKTNNAANTDRIELLEINMELLKQDRLRNNICISGVPVNIINKMNISDVVVSIGHSLGYEFTGSLFNAYTIAGNRFIIVHFYNLKHKQTLINKIRVKKSLMVEEVFDNESNSQIYLNDHLTPYFNQLYLMARTAKKEGKLASATSFGGKIRARKDLNDAPVTITNEKQLIEMIDAETKTSNSNDLIECVDDNINAIHTHTRTTSKHNNNSTDKRLSADNNQIPHKPSTRKKTSKRKLGPEDDNIPTKKQK